MQNLSITNPRIWQAVRIGLVLTLLLTVWLSRPQIMPTAARPRAMATTFNVAAGDATGLLAAINAANDETAHPGLDTIVLAGGTYTFTAANNFWYGPNALPAIASAITIEGNGATLQIGGNPVRLRFFFIGANPAVTGTQDFLSPGVGNLTLRNLTLRGGRQQGGDSTRGGAGAGLGGAIFNQGTVILEAVTLTDNRASGGISHPYDFAANLNLEDEASDGGGLGEGPRMGNCCKFPFASEALAPIDGILTGGGGGGFSPAPQGNGNHGSNEAGGNGGGEARDGLGGDGGPGGLPAGLSGYGSGGGSGNGGYRIGNTQAGSRGDFGFSGFRAAFIGGFLVLRGGGGGGVGGGGGNGASGGGGGFGAGGGFGDIGGGHGGFGGGGGGSNGNSFAPSHGGFGGGRGAVSSAASNGGAGAGAGMGGAVFNHGGTLIATNCTFTANHAQGGSSPHSGSNGSGLGGAIFNLNGGLALRYCTLAANTVAAGSATGGGEDGGAVYNLGYNLLTGQSAVVTLNHCILANSSSPRGTVNDLVIHQPVNVSPSTGGGANHATSFAVHVGKNLLQRRRVDNGSLSGPTPMFGDPLLGPLQNNGGLMPTMLPQTGSPALNAGINAGAPATDQRGVARPQGQFTDLGAVEVEAPPCPTITIQARP